MRVRRPSDRGSVLRQSQLFGVSRLPGLGRGEDGTKAVGAAALGTSAVHKSNVAALLPDGGFWDLGSGAGGAALAAAPVTYSTAWRCGSLTACLDGAKKGC